MALQLIAGEIIEGMVVLVMMCGVIFFQLVVFLIGDAIIGEFLRKKFSLNRWVNAAIAIVVGYVVFLSVPLMLYALGSLI